MSRKVAGAAAAERHAKPAERGREAEPAESPQEKAPERAGRDQEAARDQKRAATESPHWLQERVIEVGRLREAKRDSAFFTFWSFLASLPG